MNVNPLQAILDSEKAAALRPSWPKPHYRQALAHLALCQWAAAAACCRAGEALLDRKAGGGTEFTPLLDRIALAAALAGSDEGFYGRRLEVRGRALRRSYVMTNMSKVDVSGAWEAVRRIRGRPHRGAE